MKYSRADVKQVAVTQVMIKGAILCPLASEERRDSRLKAAIWPSNEKKVLVFSSLPYLGKAF